MGETERTDRERACDSQKQVYQTAGVCVCVCLIHFILVKYC